ncbi:MAG TPA: CCA tRNA nucleotidyltransferase, partial [Aestuariivirga sp.]|nr:CCA tRNA nucleotidyltransferase [Aestuariivirga sp.]
MSKLPALARARWLKEPSLQRVFAIVSGAGGEARVAGGAVRNALLGESIGDIDIATTLQPQDVITAFKAAGLSVHPTGIDHGTVTVVVDHKPYEITTLRRDVETDGRRAVVAFTDNWKEDALRRDFTINALYCDAAGKIHDYVDGYADILRKRIIFVGAPAARIREDNLRILRFFRFLAAYEKMTADPASLAACVRLKKGLLGLSAERIAREMFKLLVGPKAVPVLKLMAKHKVLKLIVPHKDEFRVIARLPPDPLLRSFALAKKPESLREAWRLSNNQAKRIESLLQGTALTPKLRENEQQKLLYAMGPEAWRDSVHLAWAKSRASQTDRAWQRMLILPSRWVSPSFPVTGRDLLDLGFPSGPVLGRELKRLEDYWIGTDFKSTKHELLE